MVVFSLLAGAGFVALAFAVLMGFEEANGTLLLVSAILLLAAPLSVLGRVALARDLTRDEKRRRLRALTGRHALNVWSAYLGRAAAQHRPPAPGRRA